MEYAKYIYIYASDFCNILSIHEWNKVFGKYKLTILGRFVEQRKPYTLAHQTFLRSYLLLQTYILKMNKNCSMGACNLCYRE